MTKQELLSAEDKIYDAIRNTYGYDKQANALVDLVMDLIADAVSVAEE